MEMIEKGQVWACRSSASTPPLLCIVGKIDEFRKGRNSQRVISILLSPHPKAKEAGWPVVAHLPIFEDAFFDSGLELVKAGVDVNTNFANGYATWLEAFNEGRGGAFSLSIDEAYFAIVSAKNA